MNRVQGVIRGLGVAAVIGGSACARPNELANTVPPETPIAIVVQNDNYLDVDVFASAEGTMRRLGTVVGESKESFSLDPRYTNQTVRIIARPIGGFGSASSGALLVEPGDTVQMTVPSLLR